MLNIIDILKSYQGARLLNGISFSVDEAEIVCLLGASGSGKSTLLRIIAGLETYEAGQVVWDGADLAAIPAHQRNFGLMFQDYALFPFLDVAENVAFGLKMKRMPKDEIKKRVDEVLKQVDLTGFEDRSITDLSGGEQQRVALARVLAPQPRLLMFDEPLGALDRNLREVLLQTLRRILRQNQVPVIFVTHDQDEAFALADRILLLHEGKIIRSGKPEDLWADPGSAWAAGFLGLGNILTGCWLADGRVEASFGIFQPKPCQHAHRTGDQVSILIRPEINLENAGENHVQAMVSEVLFDKNQYRVVLGNGLVFYISYAPSPGSNLSLEIPSQKVQCLG